MKPLEFLRRIPSRMPLRTRGGAEGGPWDTLDASEQGLSDLVTRYAAGLSISGPALSGTRSAVLTAAVTMAAPDRLPVLASRVPRSRVLAFSSVAFAAFLCALAVGITLTSVGVPLDTQSPDAGTMILPSGSSTGSMMMELAQADARLGEITEGTAERDWLAVEAAANSYTSVLMAMAVPDEDADRAELEQRLTNQLAKLQELRADAPEGAAAALDKAIARVQAMLAEADRKDNERDHPTPKPTKSPKPTKAPHPTPDKSK